MKQISQVELQSLMQQQGSACISIYAPMVKAGQQTQQNPIRFKNLVRQAAEALEERGMTPKEVEHFLRPASDLIDDTPFWQHQSDGLAVFVGESFFRYFRVALEVRELVTVEERFHLKPLLPLLSGDGRFYVLALSQKQARLLEATRHHVRELDLGDLPTSLNEALGYEVEETHIQYHTGTKAGGLNQSPVYHGQGGGEDDVKLEIRKFFNLLDKGVQALVGDRQAPLVLAGVEFLFPLYRQVCDAPHLLEGGVPGSPGELSAEELHERAWPVVEPIFTKGQQDAAGRFHELAGTGQTSIEIEDVVAAADDGRVDTLFVALGTRRWGRFDRQGRTVELSESNGPGTEDLVDFAAIQTVLKGGTVYAVAPEEVPASGAVAAVYRY